MKYEPINFNEKYGLFTETWSPKVIAEMNDYQFKLAKVEGEFVWHVHDDTDETFVVISGTLVIEFRDGGVTLNEGEMFVIPKGVEHRPIAENLCKILLIEPKGIINTGDSDSVLTADNDVWI
ncbi:cupin [Shewanella sp. OPT22]|nr:cupin [Shewanella sp. OPT22]